jgi:hypothetical protein
MNHTSLKNIAKKVAALAAGVVLTQALSAAESVTHTVNLTTSRTDWSREVRVPQFNPELGTLLQVTVKSEVETAACTFVENAGRRAVRIVTGSMVTFGLDTARGEQLHGLQTDTEFVNELGAFDGARDFAGRSGKSNPFVVRQTAAQTVITSESGLSEFTGSGEAVLRSTAVGKGRLDGANGGYRFVVCTEAAMAVSVTYTYEPLVIAADEALGTIGSRVWKDKDEDGRQDGNENGLKGWLVELKSGGTVIASVETGNDGVYGFTDVPAGVYTVKVTAKKGYRGTADLDGNATPGEAVIEVLPGQAIENADFGFVKNSGTDNNDDDDDDDQDDDQDDDDCDDDDDDDKKGKGKN